MKKYFIEFEKIGNIKYISHLDMQRLFKRGFKSASIPIEYSQGYNPHPKMGFAQPLSLGYTASKEYIEFETSELIDEEQALMKLRELMPDGINLIELSSIDNFKIKPTKSMAASVVGAVYSVSLPIIYRIRYKDIEKLVEDYLSQPEIIAKKREKKTKKMVDKDIKNQIHWIKVIPGNSMFQDNKNIVLCMELDSGSASNLSPEQVISSFTEFSDLYLPREEIEVNRDYLIFE